MAEEKHGQWIAEDPNQYGYACMFKCSECNEFVETDWLSKRPLYVYCPWCGAKMD